MSYKRIVFLVPWCAAPPAHQGVITYHFIGGRMTKRREREMKAILHERQGGRCAAPCKDYARGLGEKLPFKLMELDHIDPNGTDEICNRQGLCGHCNKVKYNHSNEYLMNRLREKWEREHFTLFSPEGVVRKRQVGQCSEPQRPQRQHRPKYRGPGLIACMAGFLLSSYWYSRR